MPVEIGQAVLNITPSMRGLQALIDREMRGADTRRAGRDAGEGYSSGFGEAAKKLTGVVSGAFAAVKIGGFAKDAIAQASDLNEVGTKMQVVFGDANGEVQAFASQGAKALGLSSLEAQNAAATFGVFGKSAGLAGKEQAGFSTGMAKLAVDMASFSNTTPEDAIEALSAGLRGESEPLRRYGVLLDDASLRQEALSMGLITTTKDALTPQQKVLASHALIMKQTSDAQGDFERTSGGLANQQRILSAQWTDAKGKLGAAFLPAVTAVVTGLNEKLFPTLDSLGEKSSAAWKTLTTGDFAGADAGIGEEDSPLVRSLLFAHDKSVELAPQIQAAWKTLMTGDFQATPGLEEDSPLITFVLTMRDVGLDIFDKLRDIWDQLWKMGEKLWPSIESIGKSLFEAWQKINDSGWSTFGLVFDGIKLAIDGLITVLNATLVPALDWLARFFRENPDEILLLVAAFTAWKVAMLAQSAAIWLVQIATKAWAVAQGILNAIMDANPITLVIIAIAALAAGIIWAYQNVDWFKNIVQVAWDIIQNVVKFAWENVIKPAFDAIVVAVQFMGDMFLWLWEKVIQPAWDGIQNVITFAWNNVIKPLFQSLWDAVKMYGDVVMWLWNEIIVPAWNGIRTAIGAAWNWVRDNVFTPLGTAIGALGDFFQGLWDKVQEVWDGIGSVVSTGWNWIRDNVFTPMGDGINTLKQFFVDLWTKAQEIWNNVSGWFGDIAKAIKGAVTTVASSIAQINNKIVDFTGIGERMVDPGGVGEPSRGGGGGFARGGVIPGMDPGRRDNKIMAVRSGESFFVPEFTRAIGGSPTVESWNRAAERGPDALGAAMGLPGFASGGVVDGMAAGTSLVDKILSKVTALLKSKSDEADSLASASFTGGINQSQDPSSFGWKRAAGIVPYSWDGHSIVGGVAGGTEGLWGALLSALVPSIPGGLTGPMWGYENRSNVNSPGNASFHAYGLATDINAPQNPNGAPGYGRSGAGVIPAALAHSLAAKFGMIWGGDFTGTPDPMHFEIHVSPGQIHGGAVDLTAAVAGDAGTFGATRGLNTVDPVVDFGAQNMARGTAAMVGPLPPGGALERWRPLYSRALSMVGAPQSLLGSMMEQMRRESSGDPLSYAIDSNYYAGHPSKGLLQTIPGTFKRNAPAGYNTNIWDPLSNALASLNYINAAHGGNYPAGHGAYDQGGWLAPGGTGINLLNRPEAVLTPTQSNAYLSHAKALEAGFAGQVPDIKVYLGTREITDLVGVEIDGAFTSLAADVQRMPVSR